MDEVKKALITSIQIHRELLQTLKDMKKYPRETYEDVLHRLIKKKKMNKK